jgi:hypothetical protein
VIGRWCFPNTPVSLTNKTDHHGIIEILLKVALNTIILIITPQNRIGVVMISVVASSVVDRGIEPRSGQTKNYKFGIFVASLLSMQH